MDGLMTPTNETTETMKDTTKTWQTKAEAEKTTTTTTTSTAMSGTMTTMTTKRAIVTDGEKAWVGESESHVIYERHKTTTATDRSNKRATSMVTKTEGNEKEGGRDIYADLHFHTNTMIDYEFDNRGLSVTARESGWDGKLTKSRSMKTKIASQGER